MAESDKTIILPEGSSAPGYSFPNFGGFGSFNSIADLFGLAIIASMFGWNGGNWGGGFNGGAGTAGFLSNQINNDSGRELIMNAINANGEASRSAISNLATMLGQDFNLVNAGVSNVRDALSSLALSHAVSVPQIINAIATGDASIISAFQKCCCEQKLLTVEQGYQSQLRTIEQTNTLGSAIADLKSTMIDQFCITGYVNSLVTPLAAKVDQIASKQLPTVNVQWPQLQAINTTPYVSGGIYGAYGYGYGNGNGWVF